VFPFSSCFFPFFLPRQGHFKGTPRLIFARQCPHYSSSLFFLNGITLNSGISQSLCRSRSSGLTGSFLSFRDRSIRYLVFAPLDVFSHPFYSLVSLSLTFFFIQNPFFSLCQMVDGTARPFPVFSLAVCPSNDYLKSSPCASPFFSCDIRLHPPWAFFIRVQFFSFPFFPPARYRPLTSLNCFSS